MSLLDPPACWYTVFALLWSAYQGARGIIETRLANASNKWPEWKKIVILDIHDFAFRFVCTLAGFTAMLVAYRVAANVPSIANISAGQAALLGSSFLVGVVGVGGQLHYLILLGRVPVAR